MSETRPTLDNYNDYIGGLFAHEDDALRAAREDMEREGLPRINVSATEGQLLHVLALSVGARRILELGTLGGYSGIWLSRALPQDGKLVSLELDPHHADVARRSLARAGVGDRVEVRVGPAAESLAKMAADGEPLFDLVFIDADKDGYPEYLERTVPLVREGGLVLADNVMPRDIPAGGPRTGIERFNAALAARRDLISIIVPVLRGSLDGLSISIKRS
jgi:predicted O-methyltransferase YrrM